MSRENALRRLAAAVRGAQAASDALDQAFAEFAGLNRTDTRCLDIIDQTGSITAGELARRIGLTTGAVTTVIDRLERAGLVLRRRDPGDRRRVNIELTPEAQGLADEIYGPMSNAALPYLESLTNDEIATVTTFLEVSRRINEEHAAVVRQRTSGRKLSLRQRLEQARRIKDEAKQLAHELKADFKAIKEEVKQMVPGPGADRDQ